MAVIEISRDAEVAIVMFNRPEVLNAVDEGLRARFIETMQALDADAGVRAVVITAAGNRAFSAGQDLDMALTLTADNVGDWFRKLKLFYGAVRDMSKPVVVALNGVAAGAGFQISLHSDLRIAHPGVRMSQPEVNAGIPSVVGSMIMREVIGLARTAEMALSCRFVGADEALSYGLINEIVPPEQVLPRAIERARELGAKPPTAMRLSRAWLRELTQPAYDAAIEAAVVIQREAFGTGEPQAAAQAFVARRSHTRTSQPNSGAAG